MIRALQTVGWSLLAPDPIRFEEQGVIAILGQNGSGKSSSLDALKAVLGARRFGAGRTAGSYRFAGRGGAPAARAAYVFCLIGNRAPGGARRLEGFGDELTLVLEAQASQRRFLVVEGSALLDPTRSLALQLEELHAAHPRSAWLRPSDYARRVLEPLGCGPAVRRLLELPQGEIGRALDRDPQQLAGLLVELSGGRDAADAFERAGTEVEEARAAHGEARRRLDRRRAELAEARLEAERRDRERARRERLGVFAAEVAAALRAADAELTEYKRVLAELPKPAPAALKSPARKQSKTSPAPALVDWLRLERQGVELVVEAGLRCVTPESAERARALLGPGEILPVAADGLRFVRSSPALLVAPLPAESILPAEPEPAPLPAPAPLPEPPVDERALARLRELERNLQAARIEPGAFDGEPRPLGELLGAGQALLEGGIPAPVRGRGSAELAQLEQTLSADRAELERRGELLEQAQAKLSEARAAWEQAVVRALDSTASRFSELCQDAGLAGRMEVVRSAAGASVELYAAEHPGEEPRALHGSQASLSGGWRASVVVLCLLACLDAAGAVSVLCLDEVGASLDETRFEALGQAFARLAEKRGLQTVMTVPSKTMSESVARFARQQIGFVRPLPGEPLAPPPHIVAAPLRAVA